MFFFLYDYIGSEMLSTNKHVAYGAIIIAGGSGRSDFIK